MSIETSIIYTTSDGKQFDDRNAWTDDGPELQAHDARREQTEERQVMTEENDLPNLTTGEWMALFHMVKTAKYIALVYPHALPLLVGKGLADKYTERLTAKGRELIEQVDRLTERDWRNIPKVKIRRAAATLWPERFLDDEDEETRNNAMYFGRNRP